MNPEGKVAQQLFRRRMAVAGWIYYNAVFALVLSLLHGGAAVLCHEEARRHHAPARAERIMLFMYLATGAAVPSPPAW